MSPRDPMDGVTCVTPRDDERRDMDVTPSNPRGDKMVLHGVTPVTPNTKKENTNTPVAPKGPTTQDSKLPRRELPADWTPNVPARIFAAEHGIDLPAAAEKFRLWALADDRRCRNWDSRFLLWLHNEKPMQPTGLAIEPSHNPHKHTFGCDHVLALLRRDMPNPDDLGCHLARLLNDGMSDQAALAELGLSDEWEAA